jgi:hypothetical protein
MYTLRELRIIQGRENKPTIMTYIVNRLEQFYPNNLVICYLLQQDEFIYELRMIYYDDNEELGDDDDDFNDDDYSYYTTIS